MKSASKFYDVTLKFQFPSWDEKRGIVYDSVFASSKSQAIKAIRRQADRDGHLMTGKGRYYFSAQLSDNDVESFIC